MIDKYELAKRVYNIMDRFDTFTLYETEGTVDGIYSDICNIPEYTINTLCDIIDFLGVKNND